MDGRQERSRAQNITRRRQLYYEHAAYNRIVFIAALTDFITELMRRTWSVPKHVPTIGFEFEITHYSNVSAFVWGFRQLQRYRSSLLRTTFLQ